MISIVIPLYNKAAYIGRTLETVLAQTCQDFEVVVVDDGSTDGSADVVQQVTDNRIRLVQQQNGGVSAARNRGIDEARGEYIAFLDADDEWKPTYLETQLQLTEKYPQYDVFATNYEFRDEHGTTKPTILRKMPFDSEDGELTNYFEVASCSHPPICSISIMVRKQAIQSVGGFPVGIKSGEDLLTWARLAVRFRIAYSRKALAVFNVEGYNFTDKPKRIPAKDDIVGRELDTLWNTYRSEYLKQYISHWHKMRSSIYLRLGMRKESIREAFWGIKSNPKNYKLYIYFIINLIPFHSRFF